MSIEQKLQAIFGIQFNVTVSPERIRFSAKEPDPFGWFLYGYIDDDGARWLGRWSRPVEVRGKVVCDRAHWNKQLDFASRFEKFMRRCKHLPKEQRLSLLTQRI